MNADDLLEKIAFVLEESEKSSEDVEVETEEYSPEYGTDYYSTIKEVTPNIRYDSNAKPVLTLRLERKRW